MKICKIIVLFLLVLVIPMHADDQYVQINYGNCQSESLKSCKKTHSHKKYKKHKKHTKYRYITKNSKPIKRCVKKQIVKKPIYVQSYIEEDLSGIHQYQIHTSSPVYINSVVNTPCKPTVNAVPIVTPPPPPVKYVRPIKHSNLSVISGIRIGTMKMTCETCGESEITNLDNSFFVGAEYVLKNDSIDYGIGTLIEFNKNNNTVPVYGLLKFKLSNQIYLTGSLGYNFFLLKDKPEDFEVEVKNGIYYAVGLEGVINQHLKVFSEYVTYTNDIELTNACDETFGLNYLYNKFAFGVKINI